MLIFYSESKPNLKVCFFFVRIQLLKCEKLSFFNISHQSALQGLCVFVDMVAIMFRVRLNVVTVVLFLQVCMFMHKMIVHLHEF